MPTKEILSKYLEHLSNSDKAKSVSKAKTFMNAVTRYESKVRRPISEFSKEDFIDMFSENLWVGKSGFSSSRSWITDFVNWDEDENSTLYRYDEFDFKGSDIPLSIEYGYRYFASEDDFIEAMGFISDGERYYRATALCAMYWLGFSQEEAISLKISDLDDSTRSVGRVAGVRKELYDIIHRCAVSKGYDTANGASGKIRHIYTGSDFILRQAIATIAGDDQKDKLQKKGIIKILQDAMDVLNELPKDHKYYGKKLSQPLLWASARFSKMYNLEIDLKSPAMYNSISNGEFNTIDVLKEAIPMEDWDKMVKNKTYFAFIENYKLWKSFFYPNK